MKTMEEDKENTEKFIEKLDKASDCIIDMKLQVRHCLGFKSNENILNGIEEVHNILNDAEKCFKLVMGKK